jgi:hypothetical protein
MSAPFNTLPCSALEVLGSTLTRVNDAYLRLLAQPDSFEFCAEAGRSQRRIARCYSEALMAIVNAPSEIDDSDWDNTGSLDEEALND